MRRIDLDAVVRRARAQRFSTAFLALLLLTRNNTLRTRCLGP
jgi:hypothetical protein